MKVSNFNSDFVSTQKFEYKVEKKEEKNIKSKIKEKYASIPQNYKIGGMVLATALAAATISGAIVRGKMRGQIRPLERQVQNLQDELTGGLNRITELEGQNNRLREVTQRLRTKLEEIFGTDLPAEEIRARIHTDIRTKVDNPELPYDPKIPPVTGKRNRVYDDAVNLPPRRATTNRAEVRPLNIPEIAEDGSFVYEIPKSSIIQTTRSESIDFTPRKNHLTTISENYADSVAWNNDKIARDILQNFFDGHGQTLDGVRLRFTPLGNGRYKVRIEGDSSYTADKAIYLGESTKRDNAQAAGNYGEGLKMSALKLLKDKGSKNVRVGSDNWELTFKLSQDDISNKRVMAFDLDKVSPQDGNFIEFETDDRSLLDTLRKSINRFYHSGNTDFRCPDFENDKIGIKLLRQKSRVKGTYGYKWGDAEKGGIYIAGQRFEFDGDFEGLEGATIFLKEKPPKDVLDPSRDRTTLNTDDLKSIIKWTFNSMSKEEKINFINILEPLWKYMDYEEYTPLKKALDSVLSHIKYHYKNNPIHINFPKDKYVAYSDASLELVRDLRSMGYTVCEKEFSELGMQTISELMGDARAHEVITPNTEEIRRIQIIKEALKRLAPNLEGEHFTPEELDTRIYLFDRTSEAEKRMSGDALAEAITDFGTSKGFWIDKTYLNEASFSEVLETALHELSHKAGGDESSEFSYKLTNVNKAILNQINSDPMTRAVMNFLNKLWNGSC